MGCATVSPVPACGARERGAVVLWLLLASSLFVCNSAILVDSAESHSTFTCEPIGLRMCQNLPYNITFMPNLLEHYDQQTAALAMEPFHPMVKLQCSPALRPFLCSLYAPVCAEYGRVALPCRALCTHSRRDCQKLMDMFGVSWPEEMDCNRFPDCDEPYPRAEDLLTNTNTTDHSTKAVQRDYGFWCPRELKVDPELGYSFLGVRDCSPPCPNMYFRREELTFARYFIGVVSIVCLSATLFTFLTFLIDVTRFRYPERPIIFYAVCYMMVSLVFFLGFLLEDGVACNAASPAQFKASTITQGSHNKACTLLFMTLYFFTMAGSVWWVVLTITWFLAAVPKWGSEAIEKKALLFHASAWGVPGVLTVALLAMNKIEGDNISGVCFVGLYDVHTLRWFLLAPLCMDVLLGVALLLAGIMALNRVRMEIPLEKENQDKLVKFMIRIGVFSILYLVPLLTVVGCYLYEQAYRSVWETTWVQERCREYHIPCPYQVEQASRPDLVLFLMKYLMVLVVGIPSVFWVGSKKTCFEWASFFHGRRRKDVVNESRQVLQEPDFAQCLLRDPNTPIVRKSRGTSTQGTSTHASSTHLAMLDDVRSVHSKMSSYHGSLHRSPDGRYTPTSHRGTEERPPYGSMPRLTEQLSRHSSLHQLDSQSQHGSARDLANPLPTNITHGSSMNHMEEQDGASA
ncbi:frizzled-3b isoform X1 [Electrophorus electricus]|uniref:Frizzled-3 n=1 Tax=Electrophorus electricus TaxID=8005 RepID=A0A4W4GU21_ELEEL|nr:frizzled-3b isoform X1 [Electrophorus electricus]XP_026867748.1 frizzled-3b isoform X1 [Electrophorus electricus]XP_026867749.1 frizzled-3b isoform X1 [Electrophorus electricus]XP_026867750.1 frizzled-3b isoform X1 [Electrophorus electricus]